MILQRKEENDADGNDEQDEDSNDNDKAVEDMEDAEGTDNQDGADAKAVDGRVKKMLQTKRNRTTALPPLHPKKSERHTKANTTTASTKSTPAPRLESTSSIIIP